MKKIVLGIIIDTDLQLPPITGVNYRLYYLSRQITKMGFDVKIFICNRGFLGKKSLWGMIDDSDIEFHFIPEKIFYNVDALKNIIMENKVNIVQFEEALTVLKFKSIVHDLNLPSYYEAHDVEATLKSLLKQKKIKNSIKVQKNACESVNRIVCMTPLDYRELIEKIGVPKSKIKLVPNPVDTERFKFYGPKSDRKNIIFIGNMYYWPNKNAVKILTKDVIPKILERHKDAMFYFIGMYPKSFYKFKNKSVIFSGPVDDINKYFKNATIAVAPLFEGSGMKVKILNYCSAGLPVVTTTIGASGYEMIKSLIVENNIDNYSKIICSLFKNKRKLEEIGRKNRIFIHRNFNINKIGRLIVGDYLKTLKDAKPVKSENLEIKYFLPLWIDEKRAKKININTYYIIKRNLIIYEKKIS